MRLLPVSVYFLPWIVFSVANVEKTIFLGPEAIHIPQQHPNLDDLRLQVLTPSESALRTQLTASFPKLPELKGTESWFLLDDLRQEQRYEVRICWAATVRSIGPCCSFSIVGKAYARSLSATNRSHSPYLHLVRSICYPRADSITFILLRDPARSSKRIPTSQVHQTGGQSVGSISSNHRCRRLLYHQQDSYAACSSSRCRYHTRPFASQRTTTNIDPDRSVPRCSSHRSVVPCKLYLAYSIQGCYFGR